MTTIISTSSFAGIVSQANATWTQFPYIRDFLYMGISIFVGYLVYALIFRHA